MGYLDNVISANALSESQVQQLRNLRDEIQAALSGGWRTGDPRFYYGGSFAKKTMVKCSYDLDLVLYYPADANYSIQILYESVESRLKDKGYKTQRRNVAIRLPYENGLHVDVVTGRAVDDTYVYANLWASELAKNKQTSIKKHIDLVRKNGGFQDVVKLLKVWKTNHNLSLPTFALELAADKALAGNTGDLENRFWTVLLYLRDSFANARLVDPANSANVVSDELQYSIKAAVQTAATISCSKKNWHEVI